MIMSDLITLLVTDLKAKCNNIDAFSGEAININASTLFTLGVIQGAGGHADGGSGVDGNTGGPVNYTAYGTRTWSNYTPTIVTSATVTTQLTNYLTNLGIYNASAIVTKTLLMNVYNAFSVFYSCKVKKLTVYGDGDSLTPGDKSA
jgi:hypothetical protein